MKQTVKYYLLFIFCFFLVVGLVADLVLNPQRIMVSYGFSGVAQGTDYEIEVDLPFWIPKSLISDRINVYFNQLDKQVSTYRQDSEISRFNRAEAFVRLRVSDDFIRLVNHSKILYDQSSGYWDGTIYSLRFGFPVSELGMYAIQTDKNWIWKTKPGLQLILNSGAQGYAIDGIVDMLKAMGGDLIRVDLGGEVRVFSKQQQTFSVGLSKPFTRYNSVLGVIHLVNEAVSTSGVEGRGHHILNPKTGQPVLPDYLAITVVAPQAVVSDMLATTLYVMPKQERKRVLSHYSGIRVYEIYEDTARCVYDDGQSK